MPDDHKFGAGLLQHRRGNLAGEGAALRPVDILRTDFDVAAAGGFNHGRKRGERRTDHDLRTLRADIGNQRLERLDQSLALGGGFVHFPVTGDDDFATHFY